MDHHRLVALVVGADVLQLEPLREVEVVLDGRQLPAAADGVAHVDVDLRPVEGRVALLDLVLEALLLQRGAQRGGGGLPRRLAPDRLERVAGGEVGDELLEPEGPQDRQHEAEQPADLAVGLLGGAEDVGVVLGEAADAEQAVEGAGPLVAVDGAQLEQPQRQLAVAAHPAAVDQAVHRAVHGLRVVGPVVQLHRRVHRVLVPIEVAGGLEEVGLGQVRGEHELVPAGRVAGPAVVLHQLADHPALRVPHGQAAAELGRERDEVQLRGQAAVVALLGLLQAVEVLRQRGLVLPCRAVDALEHRALLVPAPVRAGHLHQLERTEAPGARDVRAPAQVDELRGVAVDADGGAGGDLAASASSASASCDPLDDLPLVRLVGEELQGGLRLQLVADEGLVGGDDLAHAGLDGGQVVVGEGLPVRQVEVVVEAVVDGRADRELGPGVELGDRLGHDVRGRVAQDVAAGVGVGGDDRHVRAVVERPAEVPLVAVHPCRDRSLGEA